MNIIKALMLVMAMLVSSSTYAMTDDDHMRYTEALRDGNNKMVKKFLDGGVDINEKFFTWSALQIAASKNQLSTVKLLVERGADLNYQHPVNRMTAIHFAAYANNKEMVKYLISKGADINIKLRGNVHILRALRDENMTDMIDFLVANGAVDDGCNKAKCNPVEVEDD